MLFVHHIDGRQTDRNFVLSGNAQTDRQKVCIFWKSLDRQTEILHFLEMFRQTDGNFAFLRNVQTDRRFQTKPAPLQTSSYLDGRSQTPSINFEHWLQGFSRVRDFVVRATSYRKRSLLALSSYLGFRFLLPLTSYLLRNLATQLLLRSYLLY